jgi:hypothetical protein
MRAQQELLHAHAALVLTCRNALPPTAAHALQLALCCTHNLSTSPTCHEVVPMEGVAGDRNRLGRQPAQWHIRAAPATLVAGRIGLLAPWDDQAIHMLHNAWWVDRSAFNRLHDLAVALCRAARQQQQVREV